MAYNKIILEGNLARDIEIKYSASGTAIGKTAIAVSRKYKTATGESKDEVLFVDLVFFARVAEILNQYCRKGSKVLVDGTLKLESWTAKDGNKRSKHSVMVTTLQMLDSKSDGEANVRTDTSNYKQQPAPVGSVPPAPAMTVPNTNVPLEIEEDSIPF